MGAGSQCWVTKSRKGNKNKGFKKKERKDRDERCNPVDGTDPNSGRRPDMKIVE